jgi:hypothetical protein
VTPNLSVRGGYQAIYVAGLAEAASGLNTFPRGNDAFLHGSPAGAQLAW